MIVADQLASRPPGRLLFSPARLFLAEEHRFGLPDEMLHRVTEIDFERLAARGCRKYCFDVDNTLLPEGSMVPAFGSIEAIDRARQAGYIDKICLLSNTISGVRKLLRLERVARMYGITETLGLGFWNRKPHPLGFNWALSVLGGPPETCVMVGDQLFTDILGANRAGMYSIMVNPLAPDHWTTRTIGRRMRERLLLEYYGLARPLEGESLQ